MKFKTEKIAKEYLNAEYPDPDSVYINESGYECRLETALELMNEGQKLRVDHDHEWTWYEIDSDTDTINEENLS